MYTLFTYCKYVYMLCKTISYEFNLKIFTNTQIRLDYNIMVILLILYMYVIGNSALIYILYSMIDSFVLLIQIQSKCFTKMCTQLDKLYGLCIII